MGTITKKIKVASNDYWEVSHAAGILTGQACTLSAQHIQDGMLRIQFNREVAYYARGIVRDVEDGRKSAEEALQALEGEQKSLLDQSMRVTSQSLGLVAGGLQVTGGIGICVGSVGWACVPAGVMIGHGLNNIYENGNNLLTGRSNTEGWLRVRYQAVSEYFGGGKSGGNIAYGTADIGLSLFGAFRLTLKRNAWRLFRYVDADYVRAYKETSSTILKIDAMSGEITASGISNEWKNEK